MMTMVDEMSNNNATGGSDSQKATKDSTRIKICGLKRMVDVEFANKSKPDFAGFVFAKKKRLVTPEFAAQMRAALSPEIRSVGVFIDKEISFVADLVINGTIDMVQLHGSEDAAYIAGLRALVDERMTEGCVMGLDVQGRPVYEHPRRIPIIKAVIVKSVQDIRDAEKLDVDWLLLDNGAGTGVTFDWNIIKAAEPIAKPYFLAGGLSRYNTEFAIDLLKPYAVDVSSGVETEAGFKDGRLVDELVKIVRKM